MVVPRRAPVLAAAALLLAAAGCGDDDSGPAPTVTTTAATTVAAPTTTAPATVAPTTVAPSTLAASTVAPVSKMPAAGGGDCSAAGLPVEVPADPRLPAPVAQMRADLARAAATCDWSALALLVDRNGKAVRASFGDDSDPIGFWQQLEQADESSGPKPMLALRTLLGLPGTVQDQEPAHVQYVWPPAFGSEHPTDAELQQVVDTGLYSMETLREALDAGLNYLGYRVLITAEGDWTAFVAGD